MWCCYIYWELIVCLHHRIQWNYWQSEKEEEEKHWNTNVHPSFCVHNTLNRFTRAMVQKAEWNKNQQTLRQTQTPCLNWISNLVFFNHCFRLDESEVTMEKKRHEQCPKATEPIKKDSCQMNWIHPMAWIKMKNVY